MICPMIASRANQKSNDAIKVKIIRIAQNRTPQTHFWATLIRPGKVIIKAIDAIKRRTNGKKKRSPIKLWAKWTAELLTTACKSKIKKFKLDEDPLQRRNYCLVFIESLEMILSQYKETCELLIYYPTIGREYIKHYVNKAISILLSTNIDVHSRKSIAEFPGDGVKRISKLQSYCSKMTSADKSRYDRLLQRVTYKWEESAINYIKILQNTQALSVSVGNSYSEDQLMHIFLDNFLPGAKYSAQISSHQAKLRREGKFTDQKYLSISYL